MPKVADKNGKPVEYARVTISLPRVDAKWVDSFTTDRSGNKVSDRSKVIARIIKDRRRRKNTKRLSK